MATRTWQKVGTSANGTWDTVNTSNWGGTIPGTGDDADLPIISGITAYTVTLGANTAALNSVTLDQGDNATLAIGTFKLTASTVNDGGLITMQTGGSIVGSVNFNAAAGSTNVFTGAGTITGSIGGIGTVTASGGTLDLVGGVNNRPHLAIDSATASDLKLDGPSQSFNIAISTGNQTLEIGAAGSLGFFDSTPESITNGTILMDGGSLTDGGPGLGIVLGTKSNLRGHGVVASYGGLSGTGTITASGGTLALRGTVSSGPVLAIDAGTPSDLKIDAGATVTSSAAIGLFNTNQTLEIADNGIALGSFGSLTINVTESVTAGTILMSGVGGATLTDTSFGVVLGSGSSLRGTGKVNAALSGGGTATASGVLYLEQTVASGLGLTIDSTKFSELVFDGTATASSAIAISSANQALAVGAGGSLTINVAESITNGDISMQGGSLIDGAGLTIGSGAILAGAGKVTGPISGSGIVEASVFASFHTLELVNAIPASSGTKFQIDSFTTSNPNILQLDSTVGSGDTFAFLGADGELGLGNDSGFNDTVAGLNVGVSGAETNFVDIEHHTVTISSVSGHGTTSGKIALSDGAVLNLTNISSSNWFANSVGDGAGGTEIYLSDTPCFCRGTTILTERGEVAVEDLAVGDQVQTLAGRLKPIVWIGLGHSLVTRANKLARPVIVRRGALADNVPARDLYLTHGHALYLHEVLIPVENLINHRSILWDECAGVVEYYHIELADHDVVLANGAPAETYYDASNRAQFHNTRPESTPGAAAPTFAPVLTGGAAVDRVWMALFERAGGRIEADATDDPDLHLVVNSERLDPAAVDGFAYTFALDAAPATGLRLCSRSGVPSLLGVTAHDHRRLGVAISRLTIRQSGIATALDSDASLLVEGGCHAAENGYCWTDGELALPACLFAHLRGAFTLTIHTERPGGMRYPVPTGFSAAA